MHLNWEIKIWGMIFQSNFKELQRKSHLKFIPITSKTTKIKGCEFETRPQKLLLKCNLNIVQNGDN